MSPGSRESRQDLPTRALKKDGQDSPIAHGHYNIFTQGALERFHQDLQKMFSQGPVQDLDPGRHSKT